MCFEMLENAFERHRSQARRQALNRHPELLLRAAKQHQVVRDFPSLDLPGIAIEADIGDPVLPASVRASTHFDLQPPHSGIMIVAHRSR